MSDLINRVRLIYIVLLQHNNNGGETNMHSCSLHFNTSISLHDCESQCLGPITTVTWFLQMTKYENCINEWMICHVYRVTEIPIFFINSINPKIKIIICGRSTNKYSCCVTRSGAFLSYIYTVYELISAKHTHQAPLLSQTFIRKQFLEVVLAATANRRHRSTCCESEYTDTNAWVVDTHSLFRWVLFYSTGLGYQTG